MSGVLVVGIVLAGVAVVAAVVLILLVGILVSTPPAPGPRRQGRAS